MKKVMFLQTIGKNYGGVCQVNKLVGEELLKNDYNVSIVSFRNEQNNLTLEHDKNLKVVTINENDAWGTYYSQDIISAIKKGKIIKAFNMLVSRLKYDRKFNVDVKKLQEYIILENPDYIITSHYQLLDMIPKEYLSRTIHEQHSSFLDATNHRATKNTLYKYNGRVKFLWLTESTMEKAVECGFKNNYFIYNAVRFKTEKIADVVKNKKLIAVSRLSEEKCIDKMIDMAEEVFKDKRFSDWKLEIYGDGVEHDYLLSKIKNTKQIKLMGVTNNSKNELLKASINLNTSRYEGFSLTVLEANECGVPTVTFNFGESAGEEIINDKTGIIATDREDYIEKLKELMKNPDTLISLSKNCKDYSKKFQIENIVKDWIKLFDDIDNLNKCNCNERR